MTQELLCFGHDEMLLKTRSWVLQLHVSVQVATDLEAVSELTLSRLNEGRRFLAAVLCHSVGEPERRLAADFFLRHSPETWLLWMSPASAEAGAMDGNKMSREVDGTPRELVRVVREIVDGAGTGSLSYPLP